MRPRLFWLSVGLFIGSLVGAALANARRDPSCFVTSAYIVELADRIERGQTPPIVECLPPPR